MWTKWYLKVSVTYIHIYIFIHTYLIIYTYCIFIQVIQVIWIRCILLCREESKDLQPQQPERLQPYPMNWTDQLPVGIAHACRIVRMQQGEIISPSFTVHSHVAVRTLKWSRPATVACQVALKVSCLWWGWAAGHEKVSEHDWDPPICPKPLGTRKRTRACQVFTFSNFIQGSQTAFVPRNAMIGSGWGGSKAKTWGQQTPKGGTKGTSRNEHSAGFSNSYLDCGSKIASVQLFSCSCQAWFGRSGFHLLDFPWKVETEWCRHIHNTNHQGLWQCVTVCDPCCACAAWPHPWCHCRQTQLEEEAREEHAKMEDCRDDEHGLPTRTVHTWIW